MSKRLRHRFDIECPKCKAVRTVGDTMMRNIKSGQNTDLCRSCAHRESETPLAISLYRTRFYRIWVQMRQRCSNPNSTAWKHYGGRGIRVCERWESFDAFVEDMHSTYKDNLTIDRKNVNGSYEPSNCIWATRKEQASNTRRNTLVTYSGRTQNLTEWAYELDVSSTRFYGLVARGMTLEDAIRFVSRHRYTLNGKTQSLAKWSRELGFNQRTVRKRLARGIPFEKAIKL